MQIFKLATHHKMFHYIMSVKQRIYDSFQNLVLSIPPLICKTNMLYFVNLWCKVKETTRSNLDLPYWVALNHYHMLFCCATKSLLVYWKLHWNLIVIQGRPASLIFAITLTVFEDVCAKKSTNSVNNFPIF